MHLIYDDNFVLSSVTAWGEAQGDMLPQKLLHGCGGVVLVIGKLWQEDTLNPGIGGQLGLHSNNMYQK